MNTKKLEWEEKYSVGVKELDDQHKQLFAVINELLDAIDSNKTKERIDIIINGLVEYKTFHFDTEEKYFKKFNYKEAEDHIAKHKEFNAKFEALRKKYPNGYTVEFSFELADFLEDWLINHLMTLDQEYKECFASHGLK